MVNNELILVVDDTPANLEVICEALSDAGYEIATAIDGERALKRVHTHPPDLILLDVQMPGMDGFETCKHLKSDPATQSIPIIFMTALADADSKIKAFEIGAVDYITKPFQEREMLARVKTHLKLRQLTKNLEHHVAERTKQLHESQLQLVQSEKMSALGNLIAGVGHEINNPASFIAGNIKPARDYLQDLFRLIEFYQKEIPSPSPQLAKIIEEIDLEYLKEDFPKLITSMSEGINRICNISTSLRTFSRADDKRPISFNIHDGIDSTLMILKHRLKANASRPEIQVIKEYGKIPDIECYAGQLNQVFMNLLANAIDAIEEKNSQLSDEEIQNNLNMITISTQLTEDEQQVKISIKDNGNGIKEDIKEKIFDYLFTTKEIGKGTGLGLAIVRQIVVEKHGGKIHLNSTLGEGTEFIITLPNLS